MKNVIVVGSSNTDMVVSAPVMPAPGETILNARFAVHQGGKGANQAVAVARAGANVVFIARVGDDDLGKAALSGYRNDNINTSFIQKDLELPTGVAVITVDDNTGQNSILVAPGANSRLSTGDIQQAESEIKGSSVLLAQLEIPLESVISAFKLAKKYGVLTILNPAPAAELPAELWPLTDIITPNETETALLTGIYPDTARKIEEAATTLLARVNRAVIITLGKKGSYFATREGDRDRVHPPVVEAVDSTAAGDVFNGYLAAFLAQNRSLKESIRIASKAAAISVTSAGAQPSIPHVGDL